MQNSSVSAHIREHREKAGLTQAQLAEAVFATRQTVGNWERGATLPDIQSLQLLAGVFGVTVDELLGGDADELAREAANDRCVLMRSFIMEWVNILVIICVGLARSALRELGMSWSAYQGYSMVLGVIQWTVMLYMLFAVAGRDRVRRARDLVNATDIVAFLEGRASADELPRDWFYRWVLTKVNWWRWGIVAVLLVCFVAMGMGATRSIA
ncbi:helix-turn-helix domain-containing protein [Collinsella tanakaei]|uniref:helix-turn-helix domain-containing protein n=1 Tax=Collinsella tanakaei TaxID=626935 RepID=UPI00241D0C9F|nr:helix-turn-helix transcriptional regulator [Collinsella tanakaei]